MRRNLLCGAILGVVLAGCQTTVPSTPMSPVPMTPAVRPLAAPGAPGPQSHKQPEFENSARWATTNHSQGQHNPVDRTTGEPQGVLIGFETASQATPGGAVEQQVPAAGKLVPVQVPGAEQAAPVVPLPPAQEEGPRPPLRLWPVQAERYPDTAHKNH